MFLYNGGVGRLGFGLAHWAKRTDAGLVLPFGLGFRYLPTPALCCPGVRGEAPGEPEAVSPRAPGPGHRWQVAPHTQGQTYVPPRGYSTGCMEWTKGTKMPNGHRNDRAHVAQDVRRTGRTTADETYECDRGQPCYWHCPDERTGLALLKMFAVPPIFFSPMLCIAYALEAGDIGTAFIIAPFAAGVAAVYAYGFGRATAQESGSVLMTLLAVSLVSVCVLVVRMVWTG